MALTRVKGSVLETSVATINDLPTSGYDGQVVEVLGYHTVGDGGGGTFRYSTTSATNNGGTVVLPSLTMPNYTPTAGSCWHRQYSGAINVKWFGAYSDGTNSITTTAAIQQALLLKGDIVAPYGTYSIDSVLYVLTHTKISFSKSTIVCNDCTFMESAYILNGVVTPNKDTGEEFSTTALFNTVISDVIITNATLGFDLTKFIGGCVLRDIQIDSCLMVDSKNCFYSTYENITSFGTWGSASNNTDFGYVIGEGHTFLNNNQIKIPNESAGKLQIGSLFESMKNPVGTTVSSIGAANSGGTGFTTITLSQNFYTTTGTVSWAASLSNAPVPLYNFTVANSVTIRNCDAHGAWLGFKVSGQSYTIENNSIEYCCYGFELTGINYRSSKNYTELNYRYLYKLSGSGAFIDDRCYITAGYVYSESGDGYIINYPQPESPSAGGYNNFTTAANANPNLVINNVNCRYTVLNPPVDFTAYNPLATSVILIPGLQSVPFTPTIGGGGQGSGTQGTATYSKRTASINCLYGTTYEMIVQIDWTGCTGTGYLAVWDIPLAPLSLVGPFNITSSFYLPNITDTAKDIFFSLQEWDPLHLTIYSRDKISGATAPVGVSAAGSLFFRFVYTL